VRCGLENFKIVSFQSADALQKLLSEIDFGLGYECWIEDYSPIFGTLYYSDIFQCIQFLLAIFPLQAQLNLETVCLADLESRPIYSEMNTSGWWWDVQEQLSAGATIVPIICGSDKSYLTNFQAISIPGRGI